MIRPVRTQSSTPQVAERQTRADRRGGSSFRDLFGKGIIGPQSQSSSTAAKSSGKQVTVMTTPVSAPRTYSTTPTNTSSATQTETTPAATTPAATTTAATTQSAAPQTYRSPFQPVSTAATSTSTSQTPQAAPKDVYDPTHVPTVEEIFGDSPFVGDPRGLYTDAYTGEARSYGFRNMYFATDAAAAKIAQQLGGSVVQKNAILGGGYFTQAQPNNMILLPNGREVNAGFIAHAYTHGYPQSYIDRIIAQEIDPEGGYENLNVPVNIVKNGAVQNWALSKTYSNPTNA